MREGRRRSWNAVPRFFAHADPSWLNRAANAARLGYRIGTPAMFLAVPVPPYLGLWLAPALDSTRFSARTREMQGTLRSQGYQVVEVRSCTEAADAIRGYLSGSIT